MMQNTLLKQIYSENRNLNKTEFNAGLSALESKPIWMQIEPTTLCNIYCRMCREQVENKKWGKLADPNLFTHIYNSGWLKYLKLLDMNGWGETFLHPNIDWFLEKCAEYEHLQIQITTNGLLIGKARILDVLSNLHKVNLIFSIDSADKTSYEYIRRGASWEVLTDNLKSLNALVSRTGSGVTKECSCLVNQLNIDRLEEMVDFSLEYGFDVLTFIRIHGCPELEVPDNIAFPAMEKAEKYADTRKVRCLTYARYGEEEEISENDRRKRIWRCERPWMHMMILLDGNVVPCCYLCNFKCNAVMGNVTEMRISDIWNSEKYIELRKSAFSGYPDFCDVGINGCKAKTDFTPNVGVS